LRACRAIFAGGARWTSRTLAVKCVVFAIAIGVLVLVGVAVSVQIPAADAGGSGGALCAGGACCASGADRAARAQTVEGVMRAIAVGVFGVIFLTITVGIPAAQTSGARCACGTRRTGGAHWPLRTCRAILTGGAGRTLRAGCAVFAIGASGALRTCCTGRTLRAGLGRRQRLRRRLGFRRRRGRLADDQRDCACRVNAHVLASTG
jgi:hypothetical protein